MSDPNPSASATPAGRRPSIWRNWLSLSGLLVLTGSLFSFILLFVLDTTAHFANPYVGILTYLVAPGFGAFGLALTILGLLLRRRKLAHADHAAPALHIDLSRPRDRRMFAFFVAGAVVFLLLSAVGSYQTYHYTESVQFCGQACHTVMQPELVTYQHGSHARVACTECHIGKGATWFVRSKLSGTYQLYAVAFNKYDRPVPTPVKNLRPAQGTCEECHWPKKFVGDLERTFSYYMGDETNTPFTISLLMKVGGGDPTHGPVGGIHWHMNVGKKIEYLPADETRQKIPWIRVTDDQGRVTEFRAKNFTNEVNPAAIRRMDCMDCHNRPAHKYQSPEDAVNLAMSLGQIDCAMPWIKTNAVYALARDYKTEADALQGIAAHLTSRYPKEPRLPGVIASVQQIYKDNFFPEMRASWKNYPDNIGHKNWPGCFRCHDGNHISTDGKSTVKASDCNACHVILAQGSNEAELAKMSTAGQTFKHLGGDYDSNCTDCHTGGP